MNRSLRLHLWFVYAFLFLPIAVLVVLSFNESGLPTSWGGFSTKWYGDLLENEQIRNGVKNTLFVAAGSTAIATVLGTLLAVGIQRFVRSPFIESAILAPAVMPDIVLAIGLLTLYSMVNWPLGRVSVLVSHSLFCMAFVTAIVRTRLAHLDPSLEEAARDLGDTGFGAFIRITLPSLAPGIVAGALLAFTLSMDEFVIAFFTNGPRNPTLPQVIYANVRFGVKPDVNALATVLLSVSIIVVLSVQRLTRLTDTLENA